MSNRKSSVRRWTGATLFFFIIAAATAISVSSCQEDTDNITTDLVMYQYLCPSGLDACYTSCGEQYDQDGDGAVEAAVLSKFNTCTAACDTNCDLSFLYLFLLTD